MPGLETSLYSVSLLNDEQTPMEFVAHVLEAFFDMDRDTATKRCFSSITKEPRSAVTILTNERRKRLSTSSRSHVGTNIHSNAPSKKLFGYPRRSSI